MYAKTWKNSPLWQDNARFASKAKINVFGKKFEGRIPKKETRIVEKISKNVDFSL